MHRTVLAVSAALALLIAGPAAAQEAAPSGQQPAAAVAVGSPQEFATMAASSNMFEIASSELAVEKGQEAAVREFAQRMIDDHTRAAQEMMQAAEADGVTVPEAMEPRHQEMVSQLESAAAEAFDSQYLDMQITAHEEAVALFGSYAEQEGALADFAEKTLPVLEEHLAMVQEIAQGQ